jgi:hypothetical protein
MNDELSTPHDDLELALQEALAQRHRAALLFADAVRLDLLDDDEDLAADPLRDALPDAD